jgi:hypothetical protein
LTALIAAFTVGRMVAGIFIAGSFSCCTYRSTTKDPGTRQNSSVGGEVSRQSGNDGCGAFAARALRRGATAFSTWGGVARGRRQSSCAARHVRGTRPLLLFARDGRRFIAIRCLSQSETFPSTLGQLTEDLYFSTPRSTRRVAGSFKTSSSCASLR